MCKNLPDDIQTWINYAKELKFEERPDYNFLKSLIKKMAEENDVKFDTEFDWVIKQKNDKEKEEKKENKF